MFFTRLAVAALSFGSIAQVFAAPIATGLGGNTADVSVPAVDQTQQTFMGALATANDIIAPIAAQLTDILANPGGFANGEVTAVLVKAMDQVAPALNTVSAKVDSLKSLGVDKHEILLTTDGITKTTPETVALDVVNLADAVGGLVITVVHIVETIRPQTPKVVMTDVVSIKTILVHILDALKPTLVGAVRSVPSALIQAIQMTDDAMAAL